MRGERPLVWTESSRAYGLTQYRARRHHRLRQRASPSQPHTFGIPVAVWVVLARCFTRLSGAPDGVSPLGRLGHARRLHG